MQMCWLAYERNLRLDIKWLALRVVRLAKSTWFTSMSLDYEEDPVETAAIHSALLRILEPDHAGQPAGALNAPLVSP